MRNFPLKTPNSCSMKKYFLFLMLILSGLFVQADVVEPGEVDIYFKVVNLDQFPDYKFYSYYQTYFYEYGYQAGDLERREVMQDSIYSGGSRGDYTHIEAENANGQVVAETDNEIGGMEYGQPENVSYLLQIIEIQKIDDGVIHYKVVKTKKVKGWGKESAEEDLIPGFFDNNRWILFGLVPSMAGLGLIVLFMKRIAQAKRKLRGQYSA